jgi:hypothetical protein
MKNNEHKIVPFFGKRNFAQSIWGKTTNLHILGNNKFKIKCDFRFRIFQELCLNPKILQKCIYCSQESKKAGKSG